MPNNVIIKNKINDFKKIITVSGDKSISIRWVLFASLASGVSSAKNLLISEDVLAAISAINKLGIKSKINILQINQIDMKNKHEYNNMRIYLLI